MKKPKNCRFAPEWDIKLPEEKQKVMNELLNENKVALYNELVWFVEWLNECVLYGIEDIRLFEETKTKVDVLLKRIKDINQT